MLNRGDRHAIEAEGRRQRRVSNVMNIRLDPIVPRQIPADKDDTFIDTGRPDDHADLSPGM